MISEIKNKITQSNSFIDEAFDVKKTSNCQLIIQIGMDGAVLAVNDKISNKYIAFEKYAFQNVFSFKMVSELLDLLFQNSKLSPHVYKAIVCVIVSNRSTLVPNPLFENDKKEMYLSFNTSPEEGEVVMVDDLKALDFEVVLIEGKKLIFYNTFRHHSAEDFMYYLLFACEQLQLNPENIELVLLGEVERNSALYNVAQKYIRNLKFGERKVDADFSYQLQALPKHSYFTVFSNYLN